MRAQAVIVVTILLAVSAGSAGAQRAQLARNTAPRITSTYPVGVELRVGDTLEFDVSASDLDGDALSLVLLNPAPGLAFSPAREAASPLTRHVRWTISDTDRPGRLLFEVRDDGAPVRRARLELDYRTYGVRGRGVVLEDLTRDGGLDLLALSVAYRSGRGGFMLWSDTGTPGGLPTGAPGAAQPVLCAVEPTNRQPASQLDRRSCS